MTGHEPLNGNSANFTGSRLQHLKEFAVGSWLGRSASLLGVVLIVGFGGLAAVQISSSDSAVETADAAITTTDTNSVGAGVDVAASQNPSITSTTLPLVTITTPRISQTADAANSEVVADSTAVASTPTTTVFAPTIATAAQTITAPTTTTTAATTTTTTTTVAVFVLPEPPPTSVPVFGSAFETLLTPSEQSQIADPLLDVSVDAQIADSLVEALSSHPLPKGTTEEQWDFLRFCESTHNYEALSRTGRYRGAYQFSIRTWDWVAGMYYEELVGVDPIDASPADQDKMAYRLYEINGWDPWPTCKKRLPR